MESGASWLTLSLAILATWRLARLVAFEDGPADVVVRVRRWAGERWYGALMDCPYCLSIWFAAPMALAVDATLPGWVVAWLGVSGGASLLQELVEVGRSRIGRVASDATPKANNYVADGPPAVPIIPIDARIEEKSDVLLWEPSRRSEPRADNVRPRPLGVPRSD